MDEAEALIEKSARSFIYHRGFHLPPQIPARTPTAAKFAVHHVVQPARSILAKEGLTCVKRRRIPAQEHERNLQCEVDWYAMPVSTSPSAQPAEHPAAQPPRSSLADTSWDQRMSRYFVERNLLLGVQRLREQTEDNCAAIRRIDLSITRMSSLLEELLGNQRSAATSARHNERPPGKSRKMLNLVGQAATSSDCSSMSSNIVIISNSSGSS